MSCLFRSLSHFIENVNENELRDILVDYLEKDPILIGDDTHLKQILSTQNSNIDSYTKTMRQRSTWGGAIEIRAFCLYQLLSGFLQRILSSVFLIYGHTLKVFLLKTLSFDQIKYECSVP